jgi:hydrogenase maturation protein HypF
MAEHGISDEVIGFALDGAGFGEDGAIWGGEVLVCDLASFKRIAHFDYLPMPGGEKAILEPWRMSVSYLLKYLTDGFEIANLLFTDRSTHIKIIKQAIEKNINTPITSSCGRLFDAVAAILGIREKVTYEGQAAVMLESLAIQVSHNIPDFETFEIVKRNNKLIITPNKILQKIVELKGRGVDPSVISYAFHMALINVFFELASIIRTETGIKQVALSGGCFQNMFFHKGLTDILTKNDFLVIANREVPVNDGGISLGQAYWGMHNT